MSEPNWELLGGGGTIGGPIDYIGDWVAGTTYQPGQVVRYNGVDYISVNPSVGQIPPTVSALPSPLAEVCLFDQVLAANGSFDVQNIPSIYSHLKIVAMMRGAYAAGQDTTWLRFNGDTGNNYYFEYLTSYAATVTPTESLGNSQIYAGNCPSATAPAGAVGVMQAMIPNYAGTIFQKGLLIESSNRNGTVSTTVRKDSIGGHWLNTAAINRIQFYGGSAALLAGSRLSIYGLLGVGQAPITTLAAGGIGTSLPVAPVDGEVFTLVDSLTAPTYQWTFRYMASVTNVYKWVFIGGSPAAKVYDPAQSIAVSAWSANTLPSFVIPRPGTYLFTWSSNCNTSGQQYNAVSEDLNISRAGFYLAGGGENVFGRTNVPLTVVTAPKTVYMSFYAAVACQQKNAHLSILPVSVS